MPDSTPHLMSKSCNNNIQQACHQVKVSQMLMICDYSHWVFSPCEVILPFLESLDDRKEFSIVYVIVSLCWGEGGRVIGARVEVPVGILLHEDPSGFCEGDVGRDEEQFSGIQHVDY